MIVNVSSHTPVSREDYEDSIIPEGVDPDIVRTEKQLDFEEARRIQQIIP